LNNFAVAACSYKLDEIILVGDFGPNLLKVYGIRALWSRRLIIGIL
jgi:hypothetical protein